MDALKRKFKSLENAFNHFVKESGGELISELIPHSGNIPNNADYIFRKQNIIAELKCLKKDHYYQNRDDYHRLEIRIMESFKKGYISETEIKDWFNEPAKPGERILNILISPLRRTIEGEIRQAKRQIIESRKFFQINDAIGLIFFANEGNYFSPHIHIGIIQELILKKYSSYIDGFLYFTTDRNSEISPSTKGNGGLWLQYDWIENQERQQKISDFIWKLGAGWTEFVCKHTEREAELLNCWDKEELSKQLKSIKFIRRNK